MGWWSLRLIVAAICTLPVGTAHHAPRARSLERVTTIAPYPRGLAMVEGKLYVLCRGRVRGAGGVSAAIDDQAGTIYVVDPNVTEPANRDTVSDAVRHNGHVFALPTEPPFRLWKRDSKPPEVDRLTDRPYCTLRWHAPTQSFYLCAFSGIDKPKKPGDVSFSKNLADGLLRYDLRTKSWHMVERHDLEAGGNYPQHDPRYHAPPHGWLDGPDNCLPVGHWLYAVAKDNSLLVRYDLSALEKDPNAGPAPSEVVLGDSVDVRGLGTQRYYGQSAVAYRDGYLYIAYRTSSVIVRVKLDDDMAPVQPIRAELLARFDPYDPRTMESANITDIGFDDSGRLYVISACPARLYRFTPDPEHVYEARNGAAQPWADLAAMTHNPQMKSENLLCVGKWLYVSSGNGYSYQKGADGTVYRLPIAD